MTKGCAAQVTYTADDLLGKVFVTDVWEGPWRKGAPVVFQVFTVNGDAVKVAVTQDLNVTRAAKPVTQTVSLAVLSQALRAGTVREWDGSPLRF